MPMTRPVLDRLAVGKVALELLPELQELGITTSALPSLYPRAYDPELDAYILSFAEREDTPGDGLITEVSVVQEDGSSSAALS